MQTNDCIHHILSSQELVGPSHIHLTVALYQVLKGDPISLAEALGAQTQKQDARHTGLFSCVMSFYLKSTFIQQ